LVRKSSLFLVFLSSSLFADLSEELMVRRVHDHLLIHDVNTAVKEGREYFISYPESSRIHMAYLEALCFKGEEMEAFEQVTSFFEKEISEASRRQVSEWLAWGVLSKGESSPLLVIRLYSLLGAAFTQDARALPILLRELQGSNAFLRSLAVKLSANYGDAPLQKEILRILKEEKVWFVRLEAIRAAGTLRIQGAKEILQGIVTSSRSLIEEKGAAHIALVNMYDQITQEELSQLAGSNRAGLRQLSSEVIAHLSLEGDVGYLTPLLKDASPDVRISAMNTLGLLKAGRSVEKEALFYIQKNLSHSVPSISITAGWLASLLGLEEGEQTLRKWIEGDHLEAKRLAAAAVGSLGSLGVSLASEKIKKEKDPYTRVNLALGLIGQRKNVEGACDALFDALSSSSNDLWMWGSDENPLFRSLMPSEVRHIEQVPRYPQVVDQLTRLELLSVLSMLKHPKALEVVKSFLKQQHSIVAGTAAVTLLQEGDESAIALVKPLLEDSDEQVRVQAALILAMLGGDPAAIEVLKGAYFTARRDMKVHILEAIGHIGDPSAAEFLIEVLKEPFQGLRVVAASALIQCLYH
jgi:HEAT repeat protein